MRAHLCEPVIAVGVSTDPRWEPFRYLAAHHGLRASWSTPIRSRSHVVGTFAVYCDGPHEPDARDHELVGRFTHLTSLAVERDLASKDRQARHEANLARQSSERANHAKSQFVTALSHELRTPLQSITSFTENLQTLDLAPDHRRSALEQIASAEGSEAHHLAAADGHEQPFSAHGLDLTTPHRRAVLGFEICEIVVRHDRLVGRLPGTDVHSAHAVGICADWASNALVHISTFSSNRCR